MIDTRNNVHMASVGVKDTITLGVLTRTQATQTQFSSYCFLIVVLIYNELNFKTLGLQLHVNRLVAEYGQRHFVLIDGVLNSLLCKRGFTNDPLSQPKRAARLRHREHSLLNTSEEMT